MLYAKLIGLFAMMLLGIWICITNWYCVWLSCKRPRPAHIGSTTPIFGGVLVACGMGLLPWPMINKYAWVPLIADYGCAPGVIYAFVFFVGRWVRGKLK